MPIYGYQCTVCHYTFELEQEAASAGGVAFCQKCWSLAKRDSADWGTVIIRTQPLHQAAAGSSPSACGHQHKAGDSCAGHTHDHYSHHNESIHASSCALSVDWEARVQALGLAEKTHSDKSA